MKKIIIGIMFLLLIGNVFADSPIIDADTITNLTDNQINNYIAPQVEYPFFWDEGMNLGIKINYKTIVPIDEEYNYFRIVNYTYIPSIPISSFYTCIYEAKLNVNTCIQKLVYADEILEHNGKRYEPILYQIQKRQKQEFDIIKEYKQKVLYNKIISDINTGLDVDSGLGVYE